MEEGYSPEFRQRYGDPERETLLKSKISVKLSEIPEYFKDEATFLDVMAFMRWTRFGFPYSDWANVSNRLFQLVEALEPYHRLYNPDESLARLFGGKNVSS